MSRIDHWPKNFLLIPGFLFAVNLTRTDIYIFSNYKNLFLIFISICLASSANYVLNEYADSPTDAYHPTKKSRSSVIQTFPLVKVTAVYFTWALFSILFISFSKIGIALVILYLVLGLLYNVRPIRLKDLPYLDIVCESANNPIRLMLGWVSINSGMSPPITLIFGFWCLGGFLMGAKRLSELIQLSSTLKISTISQYRKSFSFYSLANLNYLSSILGYLTIISFSIFSIKYNTLFIFFTIVVSSWIVDYGSQISIPDSMLQNPEKLIKSKKNIYYSLILMVCFLIAQFVRIDFFNNVLETTNLNFIEFWSSILNS
jgi:4-hydroxybenzoate polyprenyltransferase